MADEWDRLGKLLMEMGARLGVMEAALSVLIATSSQSQRKAVEHVMTEMARKYQRKAAEGPPEKAHETLQTAVYAEGIAAVARLDPQ